MKSMLAPVLGETITLKCDCGLTPLWVNGDETALEQVLMNLGVNARDAMGQGGTLTVTTEPTVISAEQAVGHPEKHEGHFLMLAVADTGCGMDARTLSRIFEPFFTTKPIGRGTGLGLSTVYGIVKQHEGWIEVESTPGSGTTFRVFLPVIKAPLQQATPVEKPEDAAPKLAPEEAILVVEDEQQVRELLVTSLARHGYKVIHANSGAEALLQWKTLNCKVRLLVTDIVMPDGISGSLLAQRLMVREPALRVIYTSGYSPEALSHGDRLTEGVNFLRKPFTQECLLETVRNALSVEPSAVELLPAGRSYP
jgi:CheY-like chemotaxis protein